MLRITPVAGPDPAPVLKLEGKLVGPWTETLREACGPGGRLRLDLAGVSFADADGVLLLRELQARGVTLAPCPELIAGLLHPEER